MNQQGCLKMDVQFSENFFEDEVRDGFYIPSVVKHAWAAELTALAEIDRICQKHNITYYAEWGTLLGAVRHKGFIPWDDDLDIGMRRKDYEKFLQVAPLEFKEGYSIFNFNTQPDFWHFLARVVVKPQICFEEAHLEKYHGFPYIVGLDIFVLDNVCDDEKKEEERVKKAEYVIAVADGMSGKSPDFNEHLNRIEQLCHVKLKRNLDDNQMRIQLYNVAEKLFSLFDNEKCKYLTQLMPYGMYGRKTRYPAKYFENVIRIPFEGTTIPVPSCFDRVLRTKYGDYMRLVRNAGGHDYPFFESQRRQLFEAMGDEKEAFMDVPCLGLHRFTYDKWLSCDMGGISGVSRTCDMKHMQEKKTSGLKQVVFLLAKASSWKYFEDIYNKLCEDKCVDAKVLVSPYYYKDYNGNPKEMHYEANLLPEYVKQVDCAKYDLEIEHPEVIYINEPFDEYNQCFMLDPTFYSTNLKMWTDELVCVQGFDVLDFGRGNEREYKNMDWYCVMPGVVNADRIIARSENMKQMYVEKLTEWSTKEKRVEWQLKVQTLEDLGVNTKAKSKKGKKRLLYYTSIGVLLEYEMEYVRKLKDSIEEFQKHKDEIDVIWVRSSLMDYELKNINKAVFDGVMEILNKIKEKNVITLLTDNDVDDDIVSTCDAYYGDGSIYAKTFLIQGKPVMIQNPEI